MGQRAEALVSIAEAVRIHRALAETNPIAFLPDLAITLTIRPTGRATWASAPKP